MTWLDLIPKWVWAALVAALAATSCKLKLENGQLTLEIEKHATHIANLETDIARGNEAAAAQSLAFAQQARIAEQKRVEREKALLADAASAKSQLDGLWAAVQAKRSPTFALGVTSKNTIAPGLDVISIEGDLLVQCSKRLVEVAADADRWEADALTLYNAWPKNTPTP